MSTARPLEVVGVERIDGTEIIVEFSDGTYGRYTTEQLSEMAPEREKTNGQADGPEPV